MAAAGLGFIAFGPRGSKARHDDRLVLDYWEKWTGLEGRAMQKVVDDFNNSQSKLFIRYFSVGGIDEKAQIAIAGGAPPDILGLWNYNIPGFADTGAIIPLDELGAPLGIRPDIYATGMRPVVSYRGKMWAAINTGGTLALYYNKQHFKDASLNPDQPPRTIAELDSANLKLLQTIEGRMTRFGFHHREPGWWPFIWPFYFGGKLIDVATNKSHVDSPQVIAAYDWVRSYTKNYGLNELNDFRSTFGSYDSAQNAFISGKVSMVIQGPWLANMINLYNKGLDYGVAPFPVAEGFYDAAAPLGLVDTDILVIPRGAKHPQASMEFIAYTQRPEVVEYLSTVHCKGSPLATSSEGFLANHPNKGVRVFDAIAKSPRAFIVPQTRAWLQIRDEFVAALDEVWNLKDTPAAILQKVQVRAQAALDRVEDQARRRAARGDA
jgi:ABC-type glycerol-3-phosphate transport system substrate-binding protein